MDEFKVGDRVRYMGYDGKGTGTPAGEHWNLEGYLGKYGTITKVSEYGNGLVVTFAGGKTETIASTYLDAASTGPKVSLAEVVEFLRESGFSASASIVKEHFTPKEAVTLKIEGTPEQVKAAQDAIKALSNITVEEVK